MYRITIVFVLILGIFSPGFADLRSAVDSLNLEVSKNANNYQLHYELGICYTALGEYQNALQAFYRTLELKEDHWLARYKMALIYYQMDSIYAARDQFEVLFNSVIKHESFDEIVAHFVQISTIPDYLMMIYWILEDYEAMLQFSKKGLDSNMPLLDLEFQHSAGRATAMLGNCEDAIVYYNEALKEYDKQSDVRDAQYEELKIELAMLYKKIGDSRKAEKTLPDWTVYKNREVQVAKAILYDYYLGAFGKTFALVESLSVPRGEDASWPATLGILRIAAGDGMGWAEVADARENDKSVQESALYQAMNLIRLDSLPEAAEILERAESIYVNDVSGITDGLHAWVLERLGQDTKAKKYWFRCYGKLPLGTDLESMRSFMETFVNTLKQSE
jgi:tetratricopeptide (TPR) repeat protein